MPADEYNSWKIFYRLEPWGWPDREYRTASHLSLLWNVSVDREHKRDPKDFYRDMIGALERAHTEPERLRGLRQKFLSANKQERARMIKRSLGF